eukprot:TRINITY_DN1360_c0_g1_i1.p1 TRINITY_DN1360_c0_g1~~TRINITY_DN1360_c0_g1_i1.p1  ORF type:complete len:308 (+),score=29.87 TRINITY_DN1360_c0_g1_i1:1-924(+)
MRHVAWTSCRGQYGRRSPQLKVSFLTMAPPRIFMKGNYANRRVQIYPSVLLSILDAYQRRNDKNGRAIGTLLGSITSTTVTIKDCFCVPHNEEPDRVELDSQHHKIQAELYMKANPKYIIVGWFSGGDVSEISINDALFQEYYMKQNTIGMGVYLQVDTSLQKGKIDIKTYMSRQLSLGGKQLSQEFVEVNHDVMVDQLQSLVMDGDGKKDGYKFDLQSLQSTLQKITMILGLIEERMENSGGEIDVELGYKVHDALGSVQFFQLEEFERQLSGEVQDMVLFEYLGQALRTHLSMADKLGTPGLPLL